MNIGYLFKADGSQIENVFYCCSCGRIGYVESMVERCCHCSLCGEPLPIEKNTVADLARHAHDECEKKRREQRAIERLEKAALIEDYTGWVYFEGAGHDDGFFESIEDLLEWFEEEEIAPPEFAYCCRETLVINLDARDIIEQATEDAYEEAYFDVKGVAEFQEAVEALNKANEGLFSYDPDFKRKVRCAL